MKRLIVLLAAIIMVFSIVIADVPNYMNYQGKLTDDIGDPVADGQYNIVFKIYDQATDGITLWTSSPALANVSNGLFSVQLGPFQDNLFTSSNEYWLSLMVESEPEMTPRTQILSAPMALAAKNLDGQIETSDEGMVFKNDVGDSAIIISSAPSSGASIKMFKPSSGPPIVLEVNDSTAKVGIGTDSPSTPLVVGSDLGAFDGTVIAIGDTVTSNYAGISFGQDKYNRTWMIWDNEGKYLYSGTRVDSYFFPYTFVLRNGRVGIGTNSPSEPLVVGSDLGYFAEGTMIAIGDTSTSYYTGISFGQNTDNRAWMVWDNEDKYFHSGTKADGIFYSNTFVMRDGKVGIGTISPSTPLVVGSDLGAFEGTVVAIGDVATDSYAGISIGQNSDNRTWMIWDNEDKYFYSGTRVDGTFYTRTFVMRDGKVGINTSSPGEALHVIGNICHTGSIGTCSDIRYKNNISTLNGALDKVSQMRGVSFNWRQEEFPENKFPDVEQVGFVAQELAKVFPQVVSEDNNGYYNVDYAKLTPLLVEAIKELKSENEELRNRIENLEKGR
jgi:Chaperone of endosialidase